jgi:NADH-quinone oxidoreductase subunit M
VTNPANEHLPDMNWREHACLIPLVVLAIWIGIYPKPIFDVLEKPVHDLVERVNPDYYKAERMKMPAAMPAGAGESPAGAADKK